MKYVVVIESDDELSEDAIKNLEEILFLGDENAMYYYEITSIKQAPEPRCNLKGITEEDFWERAGYDRALRDCGVLSAKRNFLEQGFCEDAVSREYILDKIHSENDMDKIENSNLFAVHYANLVKNAPSVTPTFNKWHLVKDELPNKCSYVNITCRSLIDTRPDWVVETCYVPQYPSSPYSDWGNIPMLNNGECEVIAWMYRNIPEPYKPER